MRKQTQDSDIVFSETCVCNIFPENSTISNHFYTLLLNFEIGYMGLTVDKF